MKGFDRALKIAGWELTLVLWYALFAMLGIFVIMGFLGVVASGLVESKAAFVGAWLFFYVGAAMIGVTAQVIVKEVERVKKHGG